MAGTTTQPRRVAGIGSIPDELVMAILQLVPTVDIARSVQQVSRRFHLLSSEPKLWLERCRGDFVFWTAEKRERLDHAGRSNTGPWKQMWLNRQRGDVKSARHFEHVLASKKLRMAHLEAICRRGPDAKDFLLAQCSVLGGDDVLARRYYANSALSSINRGQAVEEWCKVQAEVEGFGHLDRALGAFDMFVLHDGDEDMDEIERILERLADEFRAANPGLATMTTRQTAMALLQWVRSKDLVGLAQATRSFRNVRNCLIGHALTEPSHPSLPIVSSAIYTSLATRVGLQAYCCAVPGHVYSTVLARPGETVDGTPLAEEEQTTTPATAPVGFNVDPNAAAPFLQLTLPTPQTGPILADNGERIFLDPYSHGQEVRLDALRSTIVQLVWGTMSENRDSFLLPAPTSAIVLRVALNLEASYAQARDTTNVLGHQHQQHPEEQQQSTRSLLWLRRGDDEANLEALLYATAWAAVLMRPITSIGWRRWVDGLLARMARRFGEDAWIVERYLVPLYDRHQQYQRQLRQLYAYPRHGSRAVGRELATEDDDVDDDRGGEDDDELGEMDEMGEMGEMDEMDEMVEVGEIAELVEAADVGHENRIHPPPPGAGDWTDPRIMVKLVRNLDQRLPEVSRRYTQDIVNSVRYRVGQVFRHRRFGFVGIINGWTLNEPDMLASRQAAAAVAADAAPAVPQTPAQTAAATAASAQNRPRAAFYTCLRAGDDRQVVEQNNVEIVTDPLEIPPELFSLAGANFKRFDVETCSFVSNMREFFPDD